MMTLYAVCMAYVVPEREASHEVSTAITWPFNGTRTRNTPTKTMMARIQVPEQG